MTTFANRTLSAMTDNQMLVYEVETYLEENFEFRRNVVSGKTEYHAKDCEKWTIVTEETVNSIIRQAKKDGIGGKKSPRQDIEEYVKSNAVSKFNPVGSFLGNLPTWDGHNHIADLFNRIPGMTMETLGLSCCSSSSSEMFTVSGNTDGELDNESLLDMNLDDSTGSRNRTGSRRRGR